MTDRPNTILTQVEYYFSNDNYPYDKFMLDLSRQTGGWIPIKALMQFPRIKEFNTNETAVYNVRLFYASQFT